MGKTHSIGIFLREHPDRKEPGKLCRVKISKDYADLLLRNFGKRNINSGETGGW
jgi:hypothetical protein